MNDVSTMPALGAAIRPEFALDPDFLTVNHGSFGAAPRPVLAAQAEWRRKLEAQPSYFMRKTLPGALRHAADRLGEFLGASGEDIGFVDNATTGCNAVLRSLRLGPGDEVVVLDHGYGAVRNTARYVCERAGARMVEAVIPFPRPTEDGLVAAVAAKLSKRARVAVIDHITSHSALVLPLKKIIDACRAAGVPALVDGAHGPAQVPVDLSALNADWYSGNCHKWLSAPKGAAFLWARRDRQADLHPVTISHGFGKGFTAEFDWTGTRDPSACLAVDAAIDFHRKLGGPALMARNAELARRGAALIAGALGSEPAVDPRFHAAMWLVRLPVRGPFTPERALALRDRLLAEFRTDAPVNALGGAIWMRISAFAYNELDDYRRLADKALALVRNSN